MRCELHPNTDAVGNCVYCGRGVCEECKVRINNLVHCKECVEAGRVKGGQPAPKPQATAYQAQLPFFPPPMRFQIRPRGPSKPYYFKTAAFGSILCGITLLIMGSAVLIENFSNPLSGGRLTTITIITLNIVGLCAMAVGCYGIYWHYGTQAGLIGIMGLIIMVPLILWYLSSVIASSSYYDSWYSYSIFYSSPLGLMYAVTYMLMHLSIAYARHFIPIFHISRKVLAGARATNIVGVGFLYTVIFLTIFGYIIVGVALIFFAIFFYTAPMPDSPVYAGLAPMPPQPGTMPPPMTPPGIGPMTGRTI